MTWADRIEQAKVRGTFTQEDRTAATHWGSCPVGEKLNIPSTYDLRFNHPDACNLGIRFCGAVNRNEITKAAQIYKAIQKLPALLELQEISK